MSDIDDIVDSISLHGGAPAETVGFDDGWTGQSFFWTWKAGSHIVRLSWIDGERELVIDGEDVPVTLAMADRAGRKLWAWSR